MRFRALIWNAALCLALIISLQSTTALSAASMAPTSEVTGETQPYWYQNTIFFRWVYDRWSTPEDLFSAVCVDHNGFHHAEPDPPNNNSAIVWCNGYGTTPYPFVRANRTCYSPGTAPTNTSFWDRSPCTIITTACLTGFTFGFTGSGYACVQNPEVVVIPEFNQGESCPKCGNPINPATGNKFLSETDYQSGGSNPLIFSRFYNSLQTKPYYSVVQHVVGHSWTHNFQSRIEVSSYSGLHTAYVRRPDGKILPFTLVSSAPTGYGTFTPLGFSSDRLERIDGPDFIWKYITENGDVTETYERFGSLISVANRNGYTQQLSYEYGRLSTVTDTFGRKLQFTYDNFGKLTSLLDPAGNTFQFIYDSTNNLSTVINPDSTVRTYHYENTSFVHALTGLTDERNVRYATWAYDTLGRATSSTHPAGVDQTTINYGANTATVTDSLSTARSYNFGITLGVAKNSGLTQPTASGSGTVSDGRTFDANGNVATTIDFNGNRTNYTYDLSRNLETSRTEGLTAGGSATAATRRISKQWHANFRLPTMVAEPLRKTTYVYNGDSGASCGLKDDGVTLVPGVLCSMTVQATSDANGYAAFGATATGPSRIWTYTYNSNGSVLTINGPRTDLADITTYTYFANNAACTGASALGCRGQISSVTNALGHVTNITEYNAHGQPLTITDPNGLVTTLGYDARLRLTSRSAGNEITSYLYDGIGQLTKVTLPDTSYLDYTYDPARRLTQITDNLGNKIVYTLDSASNRTQEQIFDSGNALTQIRSRVYNGLNRLTQEIGAAGQTTAYTYDNQGNVTGIDGPLAGAVDVSTNAYDALNRLVQMTNPLSGVATYSYNGTDQISSITDPRNLVTSYSYDGLNNLNQQVSPDTGTTVNTYDPTGNQLTRTDAKGQTTTYTYDALNRVTSITYAGGAIHTYVYDQGTNGLGRLTQITEPSSVTQYSYDLQGRLLTETRVISGN